MANETNIFSGRKNTLDFSFPLYNRIVWSKGEMAYKQRPFKQTQDGAIMYEVPSSDYYQSLINSFYYRPNTSYDNTPFNTNLINIKNKISSTSFKDDGYWDAQISEDINGRISLSGGKINKHMLMDPYDDTSGMMHDHNVFDSVEFKNLVITLEFDDSSTSTYTHKLHLDTTSISSASNVTTLDVPNESQIKRSAGVNGELDGIKDYQIGIVQLMVYNIKCGEKLLQFHIEFSFVFMYPRADFDPGGTVLANKFYPQILFNCTAILSPDKKGYKNYTDITSSVPSTVDPMSAKVTDYSARIKMVVNNNSSHHVIPSEPFADGKRRDEGYLSKFREEFSDPTKIPSQFEKIILEDYVDDDGYVKGNIVSFYTDSNSGSFNNPSGATDKRLKPKYIFDPALFGSYLPKKTAQSSPFWQNIFDYSSYNVAFEKEFIAVYGSNSKKIDPLISETKIKSKRTNDYIYPNPADSTKKITLTKMPRQGAYDNIHLHGYLGHYKDNNKLVAHAPICGYCCFHMHWRWSQLNYEVANSRLFQMGNKGVEDISFKLSSQVKPENYLGWDDVESHSEVPISYSDVKKGKEGEGMPLLAPNQQLKIAVTHPDTAPFSEEYSVIENGTSTTALDLEQKAIWYSVNMENIAFDTFHVIMEHGCGYAVDYDKNAKENIEGLFYILTRNAIQKCVEEILGSSASTYLDFLSAIKHPILSFMTYSAPALYHVPIVNPTYSTTPSTLPELFKYNDLYEILYRLMHFYNRINDGSTDPYKDYDQIPTNHSSDINTAYSNLDDMENQ